MCIRKSSTSFLVLASILVSLFLTSVVTVHGGGDAEKEKTTRTVKVKQGRKLGDGLKKGMTSRTAKRKKRRQKSKYKYSKNSFASKKKRLQLSDAQKEDLKPASERKRPVPVAPAVLPATTNNVAATKVVGAAAAPAGK